MGLGNLYKFGVVGIKKGMFIQDPKAELRKLNKCNKPTISYVRVWRRNCFIEID